MARGKKNRIGFQAVLYSRMLVLFGFIALVFIGSAVGKSFIQKHRVSGDIEQLKGEIANLEKQNTDLSQLLNYLESDSFIKQEGKIKFGLREAGEHVVVVKDTEPTRRTLAVDTFVVEEVSNPRKWWNFLFN